MAMTHPPAYHFWIFLMKNMIPTNSGLRFHCTQNITKYIAKHIWPISLTSWLVIISKVAICTSQPVPFNGHSNTHGCLAGFRNKPQKM